MRNNRPPPQHIEALTDEDRALFRQAVGELDRVFPEAPAPLSNTALPAVPSTLEPDEQPPAVLPEAIAVAPGDVLDYARGGVNARQLQRLKRGQIPIEGECDLHGLTIPQSTARLTRYIDECQDAGRRCIRVIHGKGYRSASGMPVLKSIIAPLLAARHDVLAYCSAPPAEGGTGALHVLLRKSG